MTSHPSPLADLLWQEHASALRPQLLQWGQEKNVPPVLLLSGPSGIGIQEVAQHLAHCFLCLQWQGETAGEDQSQTDDLFGGSSHLTTDFSAQSSPLPEKNYESPCGKCSQCLKTQAGQNVDLQRIRPNDGEGRSQNIKIDAFRELIAKQGFGAHSGRYKVIIIEDAEAMTVQAANSLLKILEEPPRGWIFILTVNHLSQLLPTLVSRCQRIRLRPLSVATVEKLLATTNDERSSRQKQIAAGISMGSLSRAQDLLREDHWEKRSDLFHFIQKPQSLYSEWVEWAAADPATLELLMDQLELVLYDLLNWSMHEKREDYSWLNADGAATLSQHAKNQLQSHGSISKVRSRWLAAFQRCQEVRSKMQAPLAKKLLVQDLLAPWFEPFAERHEQRH